MMPRLLAAGGLILLVGCALIRGGGKEHQETEVLAVPFETVWDASQAVLKREFGGLELVDPSHGVVESVWEVHLSPQGLAGYRSRGIAEVVDRGEGYQVRIRVRRQGNRDVWRPLDLHYADWQEEPDDATRADRVRYLIEAEFRKGEGPGTAPPGGRAR